MAKTAAFAFALLLFSALAIAQSCEEFSSGIGFSDFSMQQKAVNPGNILSGEITVSNDLNYPLTGISVSMQLIRENADANSASGAGASDVVVEFPVSEKPMSLASGIQKKLEFSAVVPPGIPAGNYALKAFAVSPSAVQKVSRVGAGAEAGTLRFTILTSDAATDYALIPRESIQPSGFTGDKNFAVLFSVENRGPAGNASYSYSIYYVDKEKHLDMERLIAAGAVPENSSAFRAFQAARLVFGSGTLEMAANESRALSVPIGQMPPGKYLLEITAGKGGTQTTMPIAIIMPGLSGAIQFASLEPFPLVQGKWSSIATCASATSPSSPAGAPSANGANDAMSINATLRATASYDGASVPQSGSRQFIADGAQSSDTFRFQPESNASNATILAELVSADGDILDAVEADYAQADLRLPSILTINAVETNGVIAYTIRLTDTAGRLLNGNVDLTLMNSAGEVIDVSSGQIIGKAEGSLVAPYGGYILRVTEAKYGVSAEAANTTPYSYDLANQQAGNYSVQFPAGSQGGGGAEQAPINPFVALTIIILVGIGLGLLAYAVKKLGGKRESRGDDMNI